MKYLINSEIAGLRVMLGHGHDHGDMAPGWSMALVIGMGGGSGCIILGWGWDRIQPLRPWPTWARTYKTRESGLKSRYDCLAWCGLFIGYARMLTCP